MRFNRLRLRRGGIRVSHQQSRFFRAVDFSVNRVKAVDDGFQLRGNAEIVHRRCENDHVRVDDVRADEFKIVFENARSVHAAPVARNARMHVLERRVEAHDFVSRLARALDEIIRQRVGLPFLRGLPVNTRIFILFPFACVNLGKAVKAAAAKVVFKKSRLFIFPPSSIPDAP